MCGRGGALEIGPRAGTRELETAPAGELCLLIGRERLGRRPRPLSFLLLELDHFGFESTRHNQVSTS